MESRFIASTNAGVFQQNWPQVSRSAAKLTVAQTELFKTVWLRLKILRAQEI
jgi:hypothetical protein